MYKKSFLKFTIIFLVIALLSGCTGNLNKKKANITGNIEPNKNELSTSPKETQTPKNIEEEIKITKKTSNKEEKLFFVAHENDGHAYAWVIDPVSGAYSKKEKLAIKETIDFSMFSSSGSSQAIQYDEINDEIYYSTIGFSAYDGSCINDDGTCANRIYRTSFSFDEEQEIIYETSGMIMNWYLVPGESRIIALEPKGEATNVININTNTNEVSSTTISVKLSSDQMPVFNTNNNHLMQLVDSLEGKDKVLTYVDLDLGAGRVEERVIYRGEDSINSTGEVSPDGRYAIYYTQTGEWLTKNWLNFNLYDFETGKLRVLEYEGTINNTGISWSGDSAKIDYILENELRYYDLAQSKSVTVFSGANPKGLCWSEDGRYLTFSAIGKGILYIYDTETDKTIEPKLDGVYKGVSHPGNVYGIKFY